MTRFEILDCKYPLEIFKKFLKFFRTLFNTKVPLALSGFNVHLNRIKMLYDQLVFTRELAHSDIPI
jgi:hypothetical protein